MKSRICSKMSVSFVCIILTLLSLPLFAATTKRVSISSTGSQGDAYSSNYPIPSISADGKYIAFNTGTAQLSPGDTDYSSDIFVRNQVKKTTELISISSNGVKSNGSSRSPSISADGRYVAFVSNSGNLVPDDTNNIGDIFVHDRIQGMTELISFSSSGMQGDRESGYNGPSISADGRYVAFASRATNLIPGDVNDEVDIFVRDRVAGTTELVSVSSAGIHGNNESAYGVDISGDGRYIVFTSRASNLVTGDTNGYDDVFIRDRLLNTTEIVSISSAGEIGDFISEDGSISDDGRYVAFSSRAHNLVQGNLYGDQEIYIRDRLLGTTKMINYSSSGIQGNGYHRLPSISADGRYVAFQSDSTNLVANDINTDADIFIRDLLTETTEIVSVSSTGEQTFRSGNDRPALNADGRYVVFASSADNLVPGDTNKATDVFVRDRSDAPSDTYLTPNSGTVVINRKTMFTSTYTDSNGYVNIKSCYLMLNRGAAAFGAGYAFYDCVKNKLYLRKPNESVMLGGFAPGSMNIIDNGCIVLDCANTTIFRNGSTLMINWSVILKSYFEGDKCAAMLQVTNKTGQADTWEQMGDFAVISGTAPINVSLLQYNSGIITLYADPAGYNNIKSCYLMLNKGTALTGSGYLY
ncbi:MAG: TolB family protein, partial [Armatimonadota bacterium]